MTCRSTRRADHDAPCSNHGASGSGCEIANDTEFGLYDYVFSKDGARALRVAKRLQAGHLGVNTAQRHHDAPFGGFKMSGVGRDGGDYGLLAYTEPQAIIWSS